MALKAEPSWRGLERLCASAPLQFPVWVSRVQSSGWDSALPLQEAPVQSLVRGTRIPHAAQCSQNKQINLKIREKRGGGVAW